MLSCLVMVFGLLLLFLEVILLMLLSEHMGLGYISFFCLTSLGFGWWLSTREGFSIWTLLESEIQNKRLPTHELIDAVLLFISGLLLMAPGILSDSLGFALVIPQCRYWCADRAHQYFLKQRDLNG